MLQVLSWPLAQHTITQYFGENPAAYAPYGLCGHEGIDLRAPLGTPVYAAHDGILKASEGPSYGRAVYVVGPECTTVYAHLWTGRGNGAVRAGEQIGETGNTGHSTGPHLHFGLKVTGLTWAAYKDWLDPLRWLDQPKPLSKLSYHVQQPAYPAWLKAHVRRSGVRWVKVMDPDYGEVQPFGAHIRYIGRFWWPGEPDKEMVWRGAAGADEWFALARPRIERAWWLHVVEGPNEPGFSQNQAEAEGQARAWVAFERRRTVLLHSIGKLSGSLVASTGQPMFALWPILAHGLGDFCVVHEYGMRRMTVDGWHLGRVARVLPMIRQALGHTVPVLVTETGVDYQGNPTKDGWRAQGYSEAEYLAQLAGYDTALRQIPEVQVATGFTWMDSGWPSFAIGESMSERITDYIATLTGPETAILDDAQHHIIPRNPYSAFYRAAQARGFMEAGTEHDVTVDGVAYRYQSFRDPRAAGQWTVYCRVGDWGNLVWLRRDD